MTDPSTPSRRRSALVPATVAVVAALVAVFTFLASRPASDVTARGTSSPTSTAPAPAGTSGTGTPGAGTPGNGTPGNSTSGATTSRPETPPAATSATDPVIEMLKGLARRTEGDPMALGRTDAPVVLIGYSEFQCPFCGKFARDTAPGLIRKYVDSGVLRIEWRDFPYLGDESTTAAVAGRAAAAQGRFWQFHDALFADQQPPNSGRLTADFLTGVARRAGLDTTRFAKDLGDRALRDAVEKDFSEGQRIGVTGTPAFLVNGTPIMGAQPAEVFERTIERAQAAAR